MTDTQNKTDPVEMKCKDCEYTGDDTNIIEENNNNEHNRMCPRMVLIKCSHCDDYYCSDCFGEHAFWERCFAYEKIQSQQNEAKEPKDD